MLVSSGFSWDEIKVPTLNGNVMLTIPSGTQTGKQFRLKDKGVKMFMDMVMVIYLLILKSSYTTKLTDRQKEIMREFAELNGESIEEQPSNFKDRARKFFKGE